MSSGGTQCGHILLWPCAGLHTHVSLHAVDAHSPEHTAKLAHVCMSTRVCSLSSLSLSLSPSLVPDIERKKFLLPQRSPCAVPFFFPPPFLNVCWKSAGFIHSKSVCSPGKKTNKKGCTAAKGGTAVPSRTTSPLQMPLVCWGELQI